MSETTSTQTAGNCGPACEGESLIIEVIGESSAEGHSFQIFDESDNEQQSGWRIRFHGRNTATASFMSGPGRPSLQGIFGWILMQMRALL